MPRKEIEPRPFPEQLRRLVSPAVARLSYMHALEDTSVLSGGTKQLNEEQLGRLKGAKVSARHFAGLEREARVHQYAFWEELSNELPAGEVDTKEKRIARWCRNTAADIHGNYMDTRDDAIKQQQKEAFAIIGITKMETQNDQEALQGELRGFWDTYQAGSNVPNLWKFAHTLVKHSMDPTPDNRTALNAERLDMYMNQLFPFFAVFGTDNEAFKNAIADHIHYLASFTYRPEERAEAVANSLRQDLPEERKAIYDKLAKFYDDYYAVTCEKLTTDDRLPEDKKKALDGRITEEVKRAQDESITPAYVDGFRMGRAEETGRYMRGEISREEWNKRLDTFDADQKHAVIEATTAEEFAYVLMKTAEQINKPKVLISRERINEILRHEMQHFQEAADKGRNPRYILDLSVENGRLWIHPSVLFTRTLENKSEDANKAELYAVLMAPDDPSDIDNAAVKGAPIPRQAETSSRVPVPVG